MISQKKSFFIGRAYNIKTIRNGVCFFLEEETKNVVKCLYFNSKSNQIKERSKIKVTGYEGEDIFNVKEIELLHDDFLYDNSIYKFNELFICTKMSSFTSIIDLEFLFSSLSKNGYKCIGITDNNNVCSWIEVEKLSEKYKIKVIFGVQFDVFDDEENIFRFIKDKNKTIEETKFIVLDLESNGLHFEDIITEIGWVELNNGIISEAFSSLIFHKTEIRPMIEKLTGISTRMLIEHGLPLKEILIKLYNVLQQENCVLITQNKFDINILSHHYKQELNIDFNPSYLDSKELFGVAFPEKRRMSLFSLCKEFNIDTTTSHRAKEDAINTALLVQIAFERIDATKKLPINNLPSIVPFAYQGSYKLFCFAKNNFGKRDIFELLSLGSTKYFYKFPRIPLSEIKKKRKDIIIVANTCREGEIFNKFFFDFQDMNKIYDFYDYIQIVPFETLMSSMYERNHANLEGYFIENIGISKFYHSLFTQPNKLIASSFPLYHFPYEYELVNVFKSLIINKNVFTDNKRYFRTYTELCQAFDFMEPDLRERILKTNIDNFINEVKYENTNNKSIKLNFPNSDELLLNLIKEKVIQKYGTFHKQLEERILYEYNIIKGNYFSDIYYLISLLLNHLRKKYNIIFGSRGSVGSSFIAFLLDITEVNPLDPHEYCTKCLHFSFVKGIKSGFSNKKLVCDCGERLFINGQKVLFEIFSGFDGKKVPDIDINVSSFFHEIVHDETVNFFEQKGMQVFRCGMIGTLQNKNAFFYLRRYFTETEKEIDMNTLDLFTYKITGSRLSSSKHPGGLIIIPKGKSIYEFTPIQCTDKSNKENLVTHFDHIALGEKTFKLDLLAHDDPTALEQLVIDTNYSIDNIRMNDEKVLSLFSTDSSLSTIGLPEFGTPFIRRILSICKPRTFDELIRISGIAHGINVWTNNAEELIREKKLTLEDVICVRDDIFYSLYEYTKDKYLSFEVMEFVRKGHTKTQKDNWEILLKKLSPFNIPEWFIESMGKISYLFPRAHAAAYVNMAYLIAYFKIYFPLEFYKSYLNRKIEFIEQGMFLAKEEEIIDFVDKNKDKAFDNKDKNIIQIYEVILEIRERKIIIENIDVNRSLGLTFSIDKKKNSIIPPLGIVKGIGSVVAQNIENESKKKIFQNISDFKRRCKANVSQIKLLQKIGAINLRDIRQRSLEDFFSFNGEEENNKDLL